MTTPSLLLLLCTPLAAVQAQPSGGPGRPDWLSGASAEFPREAYITGVGIGPDEEKAAERARGEVAKYFGVEVVAQGKSYMRETVSGKASSFEQDDTQLVKTLAQQTFEGLEVPKFWKDADGTTYALAAMEKARTLKNIDGKLEELDRDFAAVSAEMEKTEGKFSRLKLALELVRVAKARKDIKSEFGKPYRLLNPSGKPMPAGPDMSAALSAARKALKAIDIQVEASGENAGSVGERVIDDLTGKGLKAGQARESKTPDILVEVFAEAKPLPPENLTWYWAKGNVAVRMSYGSTGEVFSKYSDSAEDATRDPGSSVDRTLLALARKASTHIYQVIMKKDLSDD
ncbi:MAG: LPP20 family lipoprotein [Elusimicrobia bacterium]|nr:LPP20 family lipoprotein [Elusimicrobiota bacterium]